MKNILFYFVNTVLVIGILLFLAFSISHIATIDPQTGRASFVEINSWFLSFLVLSVIIAACVLMLAILGNYILRHIKLLHKNIRYVASGVETEVHQIFSNLRNDVEHALRFLNHIRTKRELTDEEEKLRTHLERSLDEAEREIRKEVRDISKKIK